MTRRLTRELAGLPPPGRWSDPPPLPAWRGSELAAILGIENVNSFRVQLSQWSHQGYINKIGPALYGPMPAST
ncbi:hypothetical protein ACIBIZ_20130 [Nonomuraea spiralis]|uniref:hypothetical protein n=1 Tax=Nonomuraea TaxID=83681 RepID=UPI000F7B06FF|nr:hypothetical protein [Nonomuraea sp. WAC 01424]